MLPKIQPELIPRIYFYLIRNKHVSIVTSLGVFMIVITENFKRVCKLFKIKLISKRE